MPTQTVLLVEDEPSLRGLIRRMLDAAGYDVLEARNGVEGLHCSRERIVDLVITDVTMPYVDGVSLAEELSRRANPPRLLVMSARHLDRALPAGAMFLRKPFTRDELLAYVRLLTAKHAAAVPLPEGPAGGTAVTR